MRLSFRRVFDDNRRIVIPVLAGLALNIVLYVGVVYPLIARERGAEERERNAASELAAARRDDAAARGLVEGRTRTDRALQTFYQDVLPNGPASARLITYLKLAQLARQYNLEFDHKRFDPEKEAKGSLAQLRSNMSLRGDYEDIRQFLYRVESNPDFVVIDSVLLVQGTEAGAPLTLTLGLSTYYRKNGA